MGEGLSHILHLSTMVFYLLGYVQERRLFKPWIIYPSTHLLFLLNLFIYCQIGLMLCDDK